LAKAVFRPGEVVVSDSAVFLDPPNAFVEIKQPESREEPELPEEIEEYLGPTAEELRREAEDFRVQWETEKEAMIRSARAEADAIVKEAEDRSAGEKKNGIREAEAVRGEVEAEAERIIEQAKQKAGEIAEASRITLEEERKKAEDEGREAGREEGYAEGKAEVERLIERTHTALERAQDKRADILTETEQQVIDLVLLMARKVIKVISENQRGVVVSNVVQALRKVKTRGNILIRVNLLDVKLTTEHIKDFIQMVEGAKGVQVVEDSTVDPGGCVIETDFGEIDARISSQLAELEDRILAMSPIKGKAKNAPASEGV
jgi:flagellar assembly protein FliH